MPRYLAFYKPYGVLSQFTPEPGSRHQTLAEYVPVKGVYPVGRLDWDSEGLMLLTDDGPLQHRWTDPKFAHPRTYWAQVEGEVTLAAVNALEQGVKIQDYTTRPAKARRLAEEEVSGLPERGLPGEPAPIRFRKSIPTSWLELELTEGRNRQVRKMTAAVGLPTLRLVRVGLGELRYGREPIARLAPGGWRNLQPDESFWRRKRS